jgi:peptide/nickel transport system substrate-binding protein/oligopeptide transport system substrate-binding protein
MTKTMMLPRVALSPFIGREKELGELQQRLNSSVSGECQFVVLSGEPGVGKTRLLDEIQNLARARKIRVLHGRFLEKDRAFPYQGFCEAIQEYFRIRETDTSFSGGPDFSDLAADLVSLFPILTEISQIRSGATSDSKLAQIGVAHGLDNRTQIFELLARTLMRIAGGKPLVFLMEDLHGAEVSVEALEYIVRRLGPSPVLIVGTYRTTEVDGRHPLVRVLDSFRGDRHFAAIMVGPFAPPEHRLFLETLIGGPQLTANLVEKLYDGTEGNPFFTKELVRSLLDSGGIATDDTGAWSLSSEMGIATDALPATIQQVVEKRIERLPDDLRETLSTASVIGKTFEYKDLETLVGEKDDVEDAVDRLVQDGLIEEERESRGDRLTFASGIVREVLYAKLSRRKRRSLHQRYAEQIEKRHSGRLERIYPQLVYHYSQADIPEKTVEYAMHLARTSLKAFSPEEAVRSVKTALEFLDEDLESEKSLESTARLLLAEAYRMAGDIDGALRETEAAIKIFEREKQPARSVGALVLAAEIAWQARRVEETTRWVQKGTEAARAAGDNESLRHLLSLAATVANLRGEYGTANAYLDEAARLAPGSKEAESEEEVQPGGRLVVAFANPVNAVEPFAIKVNEEREILTNVFETLITTDHEGNLVPALCEKWEVSDEGRSFLLNLRSDLRFQDGHLLTAADVKTSFERAIRHISDEMPAAFEAIRGTSEFAAKNAADVAGIVAHSDDRLEIKLQQPLPIYPALLTDFHTGIVRTPEDDGGGGYSVGTGPFRMVSHDPGRVVIERYQDYSKGAAAVLDAVEFRHGLSTAAIASGLRSGELDLARDLLPQDLEEFLRDPRFRGGLVEAPRKNTYFALFNSLTGPVASNDLVRRALCGVARTHDLVWQTLGRFAQPAVCLIPPGLLGYDPGKKRHPLSCDEAAAMLRAAGIGGPIRLKASVHPIFQDRYEPLLTALFAAWAELGVEVTIETPTMASFLNSMQQNAGLDLFVSRWNAEYDDPDTFTHGLFHTQAGHYRNYFSSAESDQILEGARAESRPRTREALYRKFENLIQESGALLPLFHDIDYRVANPKVRRLKLRSNAPYVNYSELGKVESTATATETLRAGGGIIQIPIAGVVSSLDPSLMTTSEQGEVLPNIFETLTREVGEARIVPWLAAGFSVEEGGKRYRFRLREDVRFHDGRRLTARDVRYSFEWLLQNPESLGRLFYSPIRGAKALINGEARDLIGFRIITANEFTIELDEPVSFFPALISYPVAAIIPEGSDPSSEGWQEDCVGTGPFRVVKFEPNRRVELERNKTYWRKGCPRSEGLVFSFGVSPADILSGFRAGRFSLASDLFPADVEALRREPDFASGYREMPRLVTYYAAFNAHRGVTSDKALRQHLVRAVDVASLVRQTLGRLAAPAHGLIPPGLVGHDSAFTSRTAAAPPPSPAQPPAEIELTAALNPVYFGEYVALARELANAFREKGAKIRPVNKTLNELQEAQERATVDLVVTRWIADYPDADTFVHLLHSREGLIGRLCGSPEIDQLIERGRAETSPAVRHSIYRQIEEIIVRDALLLPLFHDVAYRFARPELEGLTVSYGTPTVIYDSLRIRD